MATRVVDEDEGGARLPGEPGRISGSSAESKFVARPYGACGVRGRNSSAVRSALFLRSAPVTVMA